MDEEHRDRSDLTGFWPLAALLAILLVLPVVYVLSIGPVVALATAAGIDPTGLKVIYAPVIWLHDHTALKEPLEWYVGLWGVN
jgi:hypothetical protein